MYNLIDLFAGAGGFSLGFEQTKQYNVIAAVENNKDAKLTYSKNNPNVMMFNDITQIDYSEMLSKLNNQKVDVIIGGPPCQGFSSLNTSKTLLQNNNNQLVKEYVRAIQNLNPQVFVMENVATIILDKHRFFTTYKDEQERLFEKYNIPTLNKEFCIFENNNSVNFTKITEICEKLHTTSECDNYVWSDMIYTFMNNLKKFITNKPKFDATVKKYCNSKENIEKISKSIQSCNDLLNNPINISDITHSKISNLTKPLNQIMQIQQLFKYTKELREKNIKFDIKYDNEKVTFCVKTYLIIDYVKNVLKDKYKIVYDVLNSTYFGVPQQRRRFILIGVSKNNLNDFNVVKLPIGSVNEMHFKTVRDAIEDLESVDVNYNVSDPPILVNGKYIYNHIIPKSDDIIRKRISTLKEGQNIHDIPKELLQNYTNVSKAHTTQYKRLYYDKPTQTLINIETTRISHPKCDRMLSIREGMRIQSFPDEYIFYGSKDAQYQQLANAVPPLFAKAIAMHILQYLK